VQVRKLLPSCRKNYKIYIEIHFRFPPRSFYL
jgi:hypothetical protein